MSSASAEDAPTPTFFGGSCWGRQGYNLSLLAQAGLPHSGKVKIIKRREEEKPLPWQSEAP